jgi:hypothetical protein
MQNEPERCGWESARLQHVEYRITIKNRDRRAAGLAWEHLVGLHDVMKFRTAPTGDQAA